MYSGPPRIGQVAGPELEPRGLRLSVGLWWAYDPALGGGYQLASSGPWIAAWGVNYALGLDGISLFMVLLTTFTTRSPSWGRSITSRSDKSRSTRSCFFSRSASWECFRPWTCSSSTSSSSSRSFRCTSSLGIWGGERRVYAAIKFFLFTAFGSLLMLVGILYIYARGKALLGVASFAFVDLLQIPLTPVEQMWLFGAFALAFAIKVPVFPFHTWLPDAHVEAPTPGSVVLAAVLLKMGTYGFVRFLLPFFPLAAQHPSVVSLMLTLGVVGIIYAAWVAAVQPDAKKLVAYTSVAHMGFVVIGVFALTPNGLQGGLLVMISHGISTGALFLLLGMLYERRHTRLIEEFGGLGRVAPWLATAFVITALVSIGLPGTSGFVGEFLTLLAVFQNHPGVGIFAASGVIFAAYYMLPMVQSVFFNALEKPENRTIQDLSRREVTILAPMIALMIVIGVHPTPLLRRMEPSVQMVLERVYAAAPPSAALIESDQKEAVATEASDASLDRTVPGSETAE